MATRDDERTVDEQGRVTIPEEMREEIGIEPGQEVAVGLRGETVVIRPRRSHEDGPREDGPRKDGPREDGPREDGPRKEREGLSREEFIELMEGCINEDTVREDAEEIDPLDPLGLDDPLEDLE